MDDYSEQILQIRELFKGRFRDSEVRQLFEYNNQDLDQTVSFIFDGATEDIHKVLRNLNSTDDEEGFIVVHYRKNANDAQFRQFTCSNCDRSWWRRVPSIKMVSTCQRCHKRYDPVDKNYEFGWAKFGCLTCKREFWGFAQMNTTRSPCYKCRSGKLIFPSEILPPLKRAERSKYRKTQDTHSCDAPNCYKKDFFPASCGELRGLGIGLPKRCIHPKSRTCNVFYNCRNHHSTGSTESTFLSQDDLQPPTDDISHLPTIDDNDGGDGDDNGDDDGDDNNGG